MFDVFRAHFDIVWITNLTLLANSVAPKSSFNEIRQGFSRHLAKRVAKRDLLVNQCWLEVKVRHLRQCYPAQLYGGTPKSC